MYWTVKLEGGPRRVNHAAVAIDSKVYSFGGYCSGENYEIRQPIDVHVLDTDTYRWTALKAVAASSSSSGEGFSSAPNFHHTLHNNNHVDPTTSEIPYQRYGHTAVVWNDKAYIWGGRNDMDGASSVLHEFDPRALTWRSVRGGGHCPPARDGHSACVYKDSMIVFGGFEEEFQRFSQETFAFNFTTNRWSEVKTFGSPPAWRDFHTATVLNDKMYVFGGRSDQLGQFHSSRDVYFDNLKYLNLTDLTWHQPEVQGEKPCGRRSHSAWTHNDRMYIFGGFSGCGNRHYDELFEYHPAGNLWRRLTPFGAGPSARRRQCTVMVGKRLFLFGGTK